MHSSTKLNKVVFLSSFYYIITISMMTHELHILETYISRFKMCNWNAYSPQISKPQKCLWHFLQKLEGFAARTVTFEILWTSITILSRERKPFLFPFHKRFIPKYWRVIFINVECTNLYSKTSQKCVRIELILWDDAFILSIGVLLLLFFYFLFLIIMIKLYYFMANYYIPDWKR